MNDKTQVYELTLTRTIFTQYDDCLDKLVKTDPGEVNDFMNLLQSKLDQKLSKGNVSLLVNEE